MTSARVAGWLALKEWLHKTKDGAGGYTARLRIFDGCQNLIRSMSLLQCDNQNPRIVQGCRMNLLMRLTRCVILLQGSRVLLKKSSFTTSTVSALKTAVPFDSEKQMIII